MAITIVPTAVTGQVYSASDHNTQVRDNINGIWVLTTAGDMLYATGPSAAARLAKGPLGSSLRMGATYPEWVAFHLAKAKRTTNVLVANNSLVTVSFETTSFMNGVSWIIGDPTKLTISRTGYYLLAAYAAWDSNVNGYRETQIAVNGSMVHQSRLANANGDNTFFQTLDMVLLSSGNTATMLVRQTCGSSINLQAGSWLAAWFIGEY